MPKKWPRFGTDSIRLGCRPNAVPSRRPAEEAVESGSQKSTTDVAVKI